ncbi:MAG: heparan-alpha-glucosaminide N-acetyltransferase, partial [Microvirga sp.]
MHAPRWDAVDVARGVAVAAMVVYHFGWDLSFLKLIATDLIREPAWRWFARGIAGSFLALAGFGLALAHARAFRPRSFLTRLARIAGAAALVTAATYVVFPESYIFFGILHCIALSSVLALPFLRAPIWTAAAAAAVCFAAPLYARNPFWDHDWLDWLGLGIKEPF